MSIIDINSDTESEISVTQYVIDYDISIILTEEQKKHEVEKLLKLFYDDNDILYTKTSYIMNLINNSNSKSFQSKFKNLKPIVSFLKKIYVKNTVEFDNFQRGSKLTLIDDNSNQYLEDVENKDKYISVERFTDYILSYNNDIINIKDNYLKIQSSLWLLQRPFKSNNKKNIILSYTDAFRSSIFPEFKETSIYYVSKDIKNEYSEKFYRYEEVRLIPQIIHDFPIKKDIISNNFVGNEPVYEICKNDDTRNHIWKNIDVTYQGDTVTDIIGYYNKTNRNIKNPKIWDFDLYFNEIRSLKVKDKVLLYFNVPHFDKNNKLISHIEGLVSSTNKKIIHISVGNLTYKYNINHHNNFHLYAMNTSMYIFYKPLLLTKNIAFRFLTDNHDKQKKLIVPQSIKEYLLLEYDNIKNFSTFYDANTYLLKKYNVEIEKKKDISMFYKLLNCNKEIPVKHVNVKHPSKLDITINNSRQNKKDKGYSNIIKYISDDFYEKCSRNKSQIENYKSKNKNILSDISFLSKEEKNFEFFSDCKQFNPIIKIYNSADDLEKDNYNYEKNIYFDENLKNKVTPGDYAILYDKPKDKNILYIRKKISNFDYWQKVTKINSDITKYCNNNLLIYDELVGKNTCVIDSYDNICKKWHTVRNNKKYHNLCNQNLFIEKIINHHDKYYHFKNKLNDKINFYNIYNSTNNHNNYNMNIHININVLDNYLGDPELNYNNDNIEFKDKETYVPVKIQQEDIIDIDPEIKKMIIPMLTKCNLNFSNKIINQIYHFLNRHKNISENITNLARKKTESIQRDIIDQSKKDFSKITINKVKWKLLSPYWKIFFKNIILEEIAYIILIALNDPLSYIMNIIPFNHDNFSQYYENILDLFVTLYNDTNDIDDISYLFINVKIDKESIKNTINNDIFKSDTTNNIFNSALSPHNQDLIKSYKREYEVLNKNFKPNFNFNKNKYDVGNIAISYFNSLNLLLINETKSQKPKNKLSIVNACGLIIISPDIHNYWSGFSEIKPLSPDKKTEYKIAFINNKKIKNKENLLNDTSISFSQFIIHGEHNISNNLSENNQNKLNEFVENADNKIFHNDPLLKNYVAKIDNIKNCCIDDKDFIKLSLYISQNKLFDIIDLLNIDDKINIYNIRVNSIFHCIKITIPNILSKIIHKKINVKKNDDPLNNIIKNSPDLPTNQLNEILKHCFKNINNISLTNDNNKSNLSILCYILFKILRRIYIENNDIVIYIIDCINKYIENNEVNYDLLNIKHEEFRESHKNSQLDVYKNMKDDVKSLAKELKKMGYDVENTKNIIPDDTPLNTNDNDNSQWQQELKNSEDDYDDD